MSAASRLFEWESVGHLKYQNRTLETWCIGLKSRGTPGHAASLLNPSLHRFTSLERTWKSADRRSYLQPKQMNSEKIHMRGVNSCLDTHEGRAGAFFCCGLVCFMHCSFRAVFLYSKDTQAFCCDKKNCNVNKTAAEGGVVKIAFVVAWRPRASVWFYRFLSV